MQRILAANVSRFVTKAGVIRQICRDVDVVLDFKHFSTMPTKFSNNGAVGILLSSNQVAGKYNHMIHTPLHPWNTRTRP